MSCVVIVGALWGDEGKGKITDYLAHGADAIVRYQGGNNAGHTIVVGQETYKLHLVPSGILHPEKTCVLGNGVVLDPEVLIGELDALEARGISTKQLRISPRAHYILPTHKELDLRGEKAKGGAAIGTTGRGIGPAYRDKINRGGLRVGDPADPALLAQRVRAHLAEHAAELEGSGFTEALLVDHLARAYDRLKPHVADASELLNDLLDRGGRVLLEGAQGALLDIDHGTYPFVTSSSPTAGGACTGSGIGPTRIHAIVGVSKAYATRVGHGPFPTELGDETGELIRLRGQEYGTTTGRARRCGWLDMVALRYTARVNGMTHLAITKLDVLDEFEEIRLCTGYRVDGQPLRTFPSDVQTLARVEPVYESMPGWRRSTTQARDWTDLPAQAMAFIARIEQLLRVPVAIVSVGADRAATFARLAVWEGI
jgi:adenylosuccinate synthase